MTNPLPWPSIDNLASSYAERAERRVAALALPVTLIQRWWRQRDMPRNRQKLYPLWNVGFGVREAADYVSKADSLLQESFAVTEKLDGTNVGVRCDGVAFGRRMQIMGTIYQKTSLAVLPTENDVLALKQELANALGGVSLPQLFVYGELMCNEKFQAVQRGLAKKWFAFGLVLARGRTSETDGIISLEKLIEKLQENGFIARGNKDRVTVWQNRKLSDLFLTCNIKATCPEYVGTLPDICKAFESRMIEDCGCLEGFVLTSAENKFKWKTPLEDVSSGKLLVRSVLLRTDEAVLKQAGVSVEVLKSLERVLSAAATRTQSTRKKAKNKLPKEKPPPGNAPFSEVEVTAAIDSALTKYDALDVYFGKDQRNDIISSIVEEVNNDLLPRTEEEIKYVRKAVAKYVGREYGKWVVKN